MGLITKPKQSFIAAPYNNKLKVARAALKENGGVAMQRRLTKAYEKTVKLQTKHTFARAGFQSREQRLGLLTRPNSCR